MNREEITKLMASQLKEEVGLAMSSNECKSFVASVLNLYIEEFKVFNLHDVRLSLPHIELDDAYKLSLETDYACFAVGEDINTADAGAFFLEGYNHARDVLGNEA